MVLSCGDGGESLGERVPAKAERDKKRWCSRRRCFVLWAPAGVCRSSHPSYTGGGCTRASRLEGHRFSFVSWLVVSMS